MPKVSIIIPAYNEEKAIGEVLDRLKKLEGDYEIIVVDDFSSDSTARIAKDKGVRVITHPYNKGYGAAIKTGVRLSSSSVVFFMDADLQHDPEDIPRFCKELEEFDMVVGARSKGSKGPAIRTIGKWFLKKVAVFLARMPIPDLNSGFRAVKKDVVMKFINILPDTFSLTTTITLAAIKEGLNVKYIPIKTKERVGKSTLNPIRDGYRTILLIFSTISLFDPLRVFAPASILLLVFGSAYVIYKIVTRYTVPELGVLIIVSGLFFFFFGILAEQISQLRRQIK